MYSFERFNSWISRRALNRRYPESTVIETYRLHEWTHFLQITHQLPQGCLTDMNDENEPVEKPGSSRVECYLDSTQHKELTAYYASQNSSYLSLCKRYERERNKAAKRHQLKRFIAISDYKPSTGPLLTENETELCMGPTPTVSLLRLHQKEDQHGRIITFSSKQSESSSAKTCSSYIHVEQPFLFGQIQFMFNHSFAGNSNQFAYVKWYASHETDPKTRLIYVDTRETSNHNPIIPLCNLLKPLIHAFDLDFSYKLVSWCLNVINLHYPLNYF